MKTSLILATTFAATALVGCASSPVPADKLARSQAAITSAEEMNAARVPQAALYLRMAQDELNQAKLYLKDGDTERATAILGRAEADGQASLHLAREAAARAEAQKTVDSAQELKKQMSQPASAPMPTPPPQQPTTQPHTQGGMK